MTLVSHGLVHFGIGPNCIKSSCCLATIARKLSVPYIHNSNSYEHSHIAMLLR